MDAGMRDRLRKAGLTPQDFDWFDAFGWDDSRVPAPEPDEIADFRRREAALNAAAPVGFTEHGASLEGRLAAAIGARCADAQDRASGDED